MKVIDISNYDYDVDEPDPSNEIALWKADGIQAAIVGSQWRDKARWQVDQCKANSFPLLACYAEPDYNSTIDLAGYAGVRTICLVVEPGGIQDPATLTRAIASVLDADMTPVLYGNRGDITATTQLADEFTAHPLWFASYFNDKHVISSVPWWPRLFGHQYTSTEFVAGKARDISEVFIVPMTDQELIQFNALQAEVVTLRRIVGGAPADDFDLLVSIQNQQRALQAHVDNHSGGNLSPHKHIPGDVA